MAEAGGPYDTEEDQERAPAQSSGLGSNQTAGGRVSYGSGGSSTTGTNSGTNPYSQSVGGGPLDRDALRDAEEGGGLYNPEGRNTDSDTKTTSVAGGNAYAGGTSSNTRMKNLNDKFSFNPNDKSHRGNLRHVLRAAGKYRKATLIGAGITGGLTGVIVTFFILIPLKIEHIVTSVENRFFATSENAVERETDNMLSDYVKRYVMPAITSCTGHRSIDKNCNPSFGTTNNPVDALYKGWSQARLENKLATQYGLEFSYDKRTHRYYMKAPDIANPKGDDITNFVDPHKPGEFDKNLFQQVKRGQIRATVDDALGKTTWWKPSLLRYKTGRLLEQKYGIKRCLIWCDGRDALSDKKDSVLGGLTQRQAAAEIYLVQRVVVPINAAKGIALACMISLSCNPTSTQSTPAQTNSTGELSGAPENPDTDGALRQELVQLAGSYGGSVSDALKEVKKIQDQGAQKYLVNTALEKVGLSALSDKVAGAIPVIGWINDGAQIITNLKNAGPKVRKLSFIVNAAGAVNLFSVYRTYADEIHTGHVNPTEVGSEVKSLGTGTGGHSTTFSLGGSASAEETPLYNNLITKSSSVTGSKKYKCAGNKPISGLVCSEEKLGGGNASLNAIHEFLSKGFIGAITSAAGVIASGPFQALSNIGGDVLGFLLQNIPGFNSLAKLVSDAISPLFSGLLTDIIPTALGPSMSGGRIFDGIAEGADVAGNDTAHTILGGKRVSAVRAAHIASAQEEEAKQQFSHESFFARMFSTDSQYSLVSNIAMDVPLNVQVSAETGFASLISNPFGAISSSFASIFSGRASANPATLTGVTTDGQDFAGVNQYEPEVPNHPADYWNQNCSDDASNAYMKDNKWNDQAASYDTSNANTDPSAEPVNTTANPCLTIKSGVCSAGATTDTDNCTQDDMADANGSGGSGSGGSTPSGPSGYQNPFHDTNGIVYNRVDEGVDFAANSSPVPVYAIANATITLATDHSTFFTTSGGHADWITYQINGGPADKQYVYVSEACTINPDILSGKVKTVSPQGPYLCNMLSDSIEIGWAMGATTQAAAAFGVYSEGHATAYGQNFEELLTSLSVKGACYDHPGEQLQGSLPKGWPTWVSSPATTAGKTHC